MWETYGSEHAVIFNYDNNDSVRKKYGDGDIICQKDYPSYDDFANTGWVLKMDDE